MAAAQAVAKTPGRAWNPLFLHGDSGLGKTHLLRASAQRYRRMFPGAKVRYITGEAFTNSFVNAIRTKSVEAFEKKFKRTLVEFEETGLYAVYANGALTGFLKYIETGPADRGRVWSIGYEALFGEVL